MEKLDLGVIILTKNEERHIQRCIESVNNIASSIFVVDSFSTDATLEICKSFGCIIVQRKFINYAEQFQWAIDNYPVKSKWLMRIDADEYCEELLLQGIREIIKAEDNKVVGLLIKRKIVFMGKALNHGGMQPKYMLRVWKIGYGRVEQRWMDEHIVVHGGAVKEIKHGYLVDLNLNSISWWINKHNNYASREMLDYLSADLNYIQDPGIVKGSQSLETKLRRKLKVDLYNKLPLLIRSFVYFIYRYFIRFGFLDGKSGFIFHFLQGFWYRFLVDVKIIEFRYKMHKEVDLSSVLKSEYGIEDSWVSNIKIK